MGGALCHRLKLVNAPGHAPGRISVVGAVQVGEIRQKAAIRADTAPEHCGEEPSSVGERAAQNAAHSVHALCGWPARRRERRAASLTDGVRRR